MPEFDQIFYSQQRRPLMVKHKPNDADMAFLLEEVCKIGPNCGTLCILDQSVQDYRDLIGTYELPTLQTWGADEQLISVAAFTGVKTGTLVIKTITTGTVRIDGLALTRV